LPVYAEIAAQKSFRFFGNVAVGGDVSREVTRHTERCDAVIYAIGPGIADPVRFCCSAGSADSSWWKIADPIFASRRVRR
jgi:hypothetical protein